MSTDPGTRPGESSPSRPLPEHHSLYQGGTSVEHARLLSFPLLSSYEPNILLLSHWRLVLLVSLYFVGWLPGPRLSFLRSRFGLLYQYSCNITDFFPSRLLIVSSIMVVRIFLSKVRKAFNSDKTLGHPRITCLSALGTGKQHRTHQLPAISARPNIRARCRLLSTHLRGPSAR